MQRIEAPFAQAAGPHQARMEELVRKLWRDSGLEPPSRQRPLAPIARLLDECALNAHEVALLTRRLALAFLCERGVPVHEQYALPAPACASGEPGAAGSIGWDEPLAGFLFANEGGAALFVRAGDPIARRRFSAAHELGHYVLHFVPQATRLFARRERIQFTCAEPMPGAPAPRAVLAVARAAQPEGALETGPSSEIEAAYQAREAEAEADAFAAELLMPAALVSELAAGERACWSDGDLLWRLSQQLLVSRKALWIRLSQLGWISSASPYDS